MKIKVGKNILIDVSDGRNYTLYVRQEVLKKHNNKVEFEFVFEGYFSNVENALEYALKRQAYFNNKGLEIELSDYIAELKLISKKHLEEIKAVVIDKKLNKKRSDKNGKFMDT
ncbi:MAG: hypothetical protein WC939_00260 [Acholeplasmataceae bacterium]